MKPRFAQPPPGSILWAPIPCVTWVLPFVGHYAISDSRGMIYDFGGDYLINVSETITIFGRPILFKALMSERSIPAHTWDRGIAEAVSEFEHRGYNPLCNNCHHFVAFALAKMKFAKEKFTSFSLIFPYLFRMRRISKIKQPALGEPSDVQHPLLD